MHTISVKIKKPLILVLCIALVVSLFAIYPVQNVSAVEAESAYMRCDRMRAATDPGDCLIVFRTSSATFTEAYFKLTLDSEWVSTTNFSTTASNYTVSTTGLPAGVTAMPGVDTADNVTGNTIRFPVTAMAASTTYGFYITGTGLIANPAASTTIVHTVFTRNSGDTTTGDTKDIAVPVISDDQIAVTATVAPSFTFVFGNNSQALGTLSSSSIISGSGTGVTITTNAADGWYAWVRSANAGLNSTTAGHEIATSGSLDDNDSSLSSGTEGYLLDVDLTTNAAAGGTPTIAGEYDGADTSSGGTLSDTAYQLIASSGGVAGGDVITLIPRVAISGITPAATDYTDTLTVVGAGAF